MTTVGLQSGALKYVTEKGWLVDDPTSDGGDASSSQVDVIQAMIASASIPAWFEMQNMAGDWYVDGGIRQEVPIEAAIAMKAAEVYAIVSPIPLRYDNNYMKKGLPDIALRAATDITLDEITQKNIAPFGGWGVPVHVIRATVEVEGSRMIDPGLIRINIAYGYMRAHDILSQQSSDPSVQQALISLSDQIASARKDIWSAENTLCASAIDWRGGWNQDTETFIEFIDRRRSLQNDVLLLRSAKEQLMGLVQCRLDIAGPESTPPDATSWSTSWEAHQWDPNQVVIGLDYPNNVAQIFFPSCPWGEFNFGIKGNTWLGLDIPPDGPQPIPPPSGCPPA
jgi:hypothetical protein